MSFDYTLDKDKRKDFRLSSDLLSKIETFRKEQGFWNISIAIRTLIEAGLSIPTQTLHNGGKETKESK